MGMMIPNKNEITPSLTFKSPSLSRLWVQQPQSMPTLTFTGTIIYNFIIYKQSSFVHSWILTTRQPHMVTSGQITRIL